MDRILGALAGDGGDEFLQFRTVGLWRRSLLRQIFRKYSVLHMSLFPYRYAAAQESARTGLPHDARRWC